MQNSQRAIQRKMMQEEVGVTWPDLISQWRTSHGLVLKQAADILQVSVETFKNWEYDRHEPSRPTQDEIRRRMAEHAK